MKTPSYSDPCDCVLYSYHHSPLLHTNHHEVYSQLPPIWYTINIFLYFSPNTTTSSLIYIIPVSSSYSSFRNYLYIETNIVYIIVVQCSPWQGPDQHVQFSMRSLIWVHHKLVSKLSPPFFKRFQILTAYDSIKSLNYVISQILKNLL